MSAVGPSESDDRSDEADRIREAVLACPDVADLSAGPFGEVASYLPGRKVAGVRVDEQRIEVHVVAIYERPLQEVSDQIGRALKPLLAGRTLIVAVDDILLPGQPLDRGDGSPVVDVTDIQT